MRDGKEKEEEMPARKTVNTGGESAPRKRSKGKRTARRRRKRRPRASGILATIEAARGAAASALKTLRAEIRLARARLEKLIESERSFRLELFGGSPARGARRTRGGGKLRRARRPTPRRKGPPKADRFFKRLPQSFSLDDLRKVAGRLTGVSLAQWSRAKKVKKVGGGKYQKAT
ncbi:MAG: hypothetical protein ACREQY_05170 [Candidatus Binatia bacterium]